MTDNHPVNAGEAIQHNANVYLAGGARLTTDYIVYVLARDPANGRILLGGLGAFGVGQMWFDELERHRQYSGYEHAPTRSSL